MLIVNAFQINDAAALSVKDTEDNTLLASGIFPVKRLTADLMEVDLRVVLGLVLEVRVVEVIDDPAKVGAFPDLSDQRRLYWSGKAEKPTELCDSGGSPAK